MSFTGLDISTIKGTENTPVMTGDNTLMLIPQTFTNDNQKITIVFTDADGEHTLTHSLNGSSWVRGTSIAYSITTSGLLWEYVLEATGGFVNYGGGEVSFNVKSYRELRTSNTKQAIGWTVESYSTDGGTTWTNTKPAWLTLTDGTGNGNTGTWETKSCTVAAESQYDSENLALQNAGQRGSSIATKDCFDLSMHDIKGDSTTQNTANCYVVNAPGYYKIPLVYGNGKKNGMNNTAAYNSASFVDYNGNTISSLGDPYLKNSGTPTSAELIWQDAQNLISSVSVDNTTDNGYLKFSITSANIKKGNALLSVKDAEGIIMWSWHIWVTIAAVWSTTKVTAPGTTYDAMPMNLGWVNGSTTKAYSTRNVKVKVKQTDGISTKRAVFTITQGSNEVSRIYTGYNTFYQWGRNIPMPPSTGTGNTQHTLYKIDGTNVNLIAAAGGRTIGFTIKNPLTYFLGSTTSYWCSTAYNDLWDSGNGTTVYGSNPFNHASSTKTVYDPSPAGFKVPPAKFFKGWSRSSSQNYGAIYNVGNSNTIYIPWAGYIEYSAGSYTAVNSLHTYNTATPNSNTSGEHLTSSTSISVNGSTTKSQAFANRSIAE